MHADVRRTLRLQECDQRIGELRREIATLPKQIAEIERLLESHTKRLELDKTALAANQRERKKLEVDVQTHQQKVSKLRDQMLGAKTNEVYRAFQKEIDYEEGAIRKAEDRILDLMLEAESLEKNVKSAEVALTAEKKVVDAKKLEAKARTDQDKAELERVERDRAEAAGALPQGVLAAYERLRQRHKDGIAVAEAKDGLCTACNLAMRPQHFQDIKRGEEVICCENCKRILYHAQVEDPAGSSNP